MYVQKPNDATADLMWELLRSLEGHLGKAAGPLDAELIRAAYRHMSFLTGRTLIPDVVEPRYLNRSPDSPSVDCQWCGGDGFARDTERAVTGLCHHPVHHIPSTSCATYPVKVTA